MRRPAIACALALLVATLAAAQNVTLFSNKNQGPPDAAGV